MTKKLDEMLKNGMIDTTYMDAQKKIKKATLDHQSRLRSIEIQKKYKSVYDQHGKVYNSIDVSQNDRRTNEANIQKEKVIRYRMQQKKETYPMTDHHEFQTDTSYRDKISTDRKTGLNYHEMDQAHKQSLYNDYVQQ